MEAAASNEEKVSLTPLLFALWLEEPPLGNEALFIFQTERSLMHEKWESRGKRGNLDPNQVEARYTSVRWSSAERCLFLGKLTVANGGSI